MPLAAPALIAFADTLLPLLERDALLQEEALTLSQQLTGGLVACDNEQVERATHALGEWEVRRRPVARELADLAEVWEGAGEAPPFAISYVLQRLTMVGDPRDRGWRLGAAAGQLRATTLTLAAQTDLNRLLIEQHADILHHTYQAIARALTGASTGSSYDAHGSGAEGPATATLLDARG